MTKIYLTDNTPAHVEGSDAGITNELRTAQKVVLDGGIYIEARDVMWHVPCAMVEDKIAGTLAVHFNLEDAYETDPRHAEVPEELSLAGACLDLLRGAKPFVVLPVSVGQLGWWALHDGDLFTGPMNADGSLDTYHCRFADMSDYGGSDRATVVMAESMLAIAYGSDEGRIVTPKPTAAPVPVASKDEWDETFSRTVIGSVNDERRYVPVVDRSLPFAVGQVEDDSATDKELQRKHGHREGALLRGTPSLFLTTPGDIQHYLTWEEAYNLGAALIDVANVSLYG